MRGCAPGLNALGNSCSEKPVVASPVEFEYPTKRSLWCPELNFPSGNRKSQTKKTLTMIFFQIWRRWGRGRMVDGEGEGWLMGKAQCTHAQLCLTPCDTLDCNPPGSSDQGILQANTGVVYHLLLQGIFLTQGSKPCLLLLLPWQADSLPLRHLGSRHVG